MENVAIRKFRGEDAEAAAQLFFDSVHLGTQEHYSRAQRQAWAPVVPETSAWRDRLRAQTSFVAEQDGRLIGYMTINEEGHIDLAYVAPGFIGKGVASHLYEAIESEAREAGLKQLTSDASHLARAFFERRGWTLVKEQTVTRHAVALINFAMVKNL